VRKSTAPAPRSPRPSWRDRLQLALAQTQIGQRVLAVGVPPRIGHKPAAPARHLGSSHFDLDPAVVAAAMQHPEDERVLAEVEVGLGLKRTSSPHTSRKS
jgi:hypothetical protein